MRVRGYIEKLDDLKQLAVSVGDKGVPIRLGDIATIQVKRGDEVLFYGVQLPVHEHLRRLLREIFLRESSSQSSPG